MVDHGAAKRANEANDAAVAGERKGVRGGRPQATRLRRDTLADAGYATTRVA